MQNGIKYYAEASRSDRKLRRSGTVKKTEVCVARSISQSPYPMRFDVELSIWLLNISV